MNSYWPGQGVRIKTSSVFAVSGAAADPTVVTVTVRLPAGTVTTYTYGVDGAVKKAGTGNYYMDITIGTTTADEGKYCYAWRGTGTVIAADECQFEAKKSMVRTVP